jgi:BolA family transcriptional regulator, general stress-responsive regulator
MRPSETGPIATEMLRRLDSALHPTRIELADDSEQHRGHGGYNPAGESHFSLRIESRAFGGKSRVERQRLIYAALGDLMKERVHALAIRATAPGEY